MSELIVRTIGIDVHKDTYSLAAFNPKNGSFSAECTTMANTRSVINYIKRFREEIGEPVEIKVGYEAGPTGFNLKRDLDKAGIECHIMAPTSIFRPAAGVRVKTDTRDAQLLAKALYWGSYSEVTPPSKETEAYRDYIRMRDDSNEDLKRAKQHLLSFLLRNDVKYSGGSPWTLKHLAWLKKVKFDNPINQETFDEYFNKVITLKNEVELKDAKIEEFSRQECFKAKVDKLRCFSGIDTHTAMVLLCEIGDFNRFASAEAFASFLGLCPGEHSSGKKQQKTGITKAGNSHCRKLLIESANSMAGTNPYRKSKRILQRQKGQDVTVIAYADRGTKRIKKKYISLVERGKSRNTAKTACARELACFIWGMMTGNMDTREEKAALALVNS